MARKDARLGLTLTQEEKQTLQEIARIRHTSEAATVRWLILREKRRREQRREAGLCATT